jgi:expansin (peptidoglycan-binding protein)
VTIRQRWVIAAAGAVVLAVAGVGFASALGRDSGTALDATLDTLPLTSATPAVPGSIPASTTPTASAPTPSPTPTRTKKKPKKRKKENPAKSSGVITGQGRIRYGTTYTGSGTFYAATGAGNCSFEASDNLMIGAMNHQDYAGSRACGDYLAVTGPNGKTITIKVVDQCPECKPGAIDLSKEAFTKLAPASTGLIKIRWHLLSPSLSGPVAYKYKDGSSRWWCAIQVRNHRNPVRSVELRVGSDWKSLPRADYNYFLSENGSGCGGTIRVTDIYGNRLTDSAIAISPGSVQSGQAQFRSPK